MENYGFQQSSKLFSSFKTKLFRFEYFILLTREIMIQMPSTIFLETLCPSVLVKLKAYISRNRESDPFFPKNSDEKYLAKRVVRIKESLKPSTQLRRI